MKRRNILLVLATMMTLVGTATTACAEALGDGMKVAGFNPGWILILIALFVAGVSYVGLINKKLISVAVGIALLGAIFVVPIETTEETPTATIVDDDCCPFEVTGSAITTGSNYISDTTWDEDALTLTIPLTVSDSSDGNLSGHKAGVNLTIEPLCDSGDADKYRIYTVDSEYLMKYGGEYLLDEDSTGYNAIWTTTEGTEYYDDNIKIGDDTSDWAQIDYTFVNGTSGSWVSELSSIGDSKTWDVTISNDCYTETITVQAMVVSYTA